MEFRTREELAEEAARKYYYEDKKQAQIGRELGMTPGNVSRILQWARDTGIVSIMINSGGAVERLGDLETELAEQFTLQSAIVINAPDPEMDLNKQRVFDVRNDDDLHRNLGKAFAGHLRGSLRNSDHIGVGGGRATFYTAIALGRTHPHPVQENIRITSLNGNADTRIWDYKSPNRDRGIPLDADTAALYLARAFANGAVPQRLCLPLINSPEDLRKVWAKANLRKNRAQIISPKLWSEEPNTFRPNMAIVGIGVLGGGHCFVRQPNIFGRTTATQSDLNELISLQKDLRKKTGYTAVGDICNRLFLTDPSDDGNGDSSKHNWNRIRELINKINSRLLTIEFEQLRAVDTVYVVAGGWIKTDVIFWVLTTRLIPVTTLVTDRIVAEELIARKKGLG